MQQTLHPFPGTLRRIGPQGHGNVERLMGWHASLRHKSAVFPREMGPNGLLSCDLVAQIMEATFIKGPVMTIFKKATLAVALVVAGGQVLAASPIGQTDTYDFGSLTTSKGVSVGDPLFGFSGSFDNFFSFTIPMVSSVQGLFAGIDAVGDITAAYRVGTGTAGHQTWLSLMPAAVPVPQNAIGDFNISSAYSGLAAGSTYWIEISGYATQASYSLTLTPAAPVPEPESWAMLLAGLGAMGTIANRRRRLAFK